MSAPRAVGSACPVGKLRGGGSCGRGVYEVYEGLKVLAVCPRGVRSGPVPGLQCLIMYIMLTLGWQAFLNDFVDLRVAGGRQ